jgi:AcrR family transcriptional regulator
MTPVMGTKSMPRATREQEMLDAAERVFAERGYRPASMNEIAETAGISKALLYSYFDSKEGLYIACVERVRARLFQRAEAAAAAADDPAGQLEAFVRVFFDHIDEGREAWWVLYGEASAAAIGEMRRKNAELIARLLRAAARATNGLPSDAAVELLAYSLVGGGELAARWWLEHPEVPKEQVVDRYVRFSARAIADGLRP